ncbi:MAG: enoyl-CoA hydratase [Sphingomonadales bacterium]|nr:enoyl-CoA hydratase [Sphingomonadales bacterium]
MELVLFEKKAGVAQITINRPDKMNALNRAVLAELDRCFQQALSDPKLFGVVITGAGDRAFVAGADISEFAHYSAEEARELSTFGQGLFRRIEESPKPVVAAVHGFALGGGCELAMACHLRIATRAARFGQPEVSLGVVPGYGGTQRLVQLVGKAKALEMLCTGDPIDAGEAHRLGLANHVVEEQSELLPHAHAVLQRMFLRGGQAVAGCIELVNDFFHADRDGYAQESACFGRLFESDEFREGVGAFMEKRKPNFRQKP